MLIKFTFFTVYIVTLTLVIALIYNEWQYFLNPDPTFQFVPDTDFASKLRINIDMTVAMPCDSKYIFFINWLLNSWIKFVKIRNSFFREQSCEHSNLCQTRILLPNFVFTRRLRIPLSHAATQNNVGIFFVISNGHRGNNMIWYWYRMCSILGIMLIITNLILDDMLLLGSLIPSLLSSL
jgi:hypothetical protein